MNLVKILEEHALLQPDHVALKDCRDGTERAITYAELKTRTEIAALRLIDSGIKKNDRILLAVPLSMETYIVLLAIFRIGAVAVIVDSALGAKTLKQSLTLVQPDAMISTLRVQLLGTLISQVRKIEVKLDVEKIVGPMDEIEKNDISDNRKGFTHQARAIERVETEHPALITFTSGSTGIPKAIVRSHDFLLNQQRVIASSLPCNKNDVELTTLPVFVLSALALGITSVLPDCDMRKPASINARRVIRQLKSCGVNRIIGSPAFFQRLVEHLKTENTTLLSLTDILTGGGPVFPSLMKELEVVFPCAKVIAVYGSTEAEPIAHINSSSMSAEDLQRTFEGGGLLAGKPIDEIELAIVDPAELNAFSRGAVNRKFHRLPAYVTGEIVVRGKHVVKTYLNGTGDAETKVAIESKLSHTSKIWHRTGDAGYLDADGRLWLMGRCAMKISDEKGILYPFQVEVAASEIPSVARATCVRSEGKRILVIEKKHFTLLQWVSNFLKHTAIRKGGNASTTGSHTRPTIKDAFAWLRFDEIRWVRSMPVDARHNSKIQYGLLEQNLRHAWLH